MNEHVTKLFLDWHEKRVNAAIGEQIDRHIANCAGCKMYFDKMSAVFDDPSHLKLKELQTNPYLPTRIHAMRAESGSHRSFAPVLRWTFAGVGATVAIVIGIYLGNGLSSSQQSSSTATDLSAYHNVIAQHGVIEQWNDAAASSEGEQQ